MTNNDRPAEASDDQGSRAIPAAPSTGTLVIHIWSEAGPGSGFRARLTYRKQDDGEPAMSYFATPADVVNAVREWLDIPSDPTHPR
ncbi:hypothetical protein [Arthrobacter sp. NyZ413]|uniref:hypothetical protein n=1 Tax=Arthrobacter sp. NyZ413 TaxID=3144669 RepID=UPI003BF8838B